MFTYLDYLGEVTEAAAQVSAADLQALKALLDDVRAKDGTVFVAGNGGSATVAEHLALGLSLNALRETGSAMRAFALHAGGSALSGAVNDFGAEEMYAAQLEALARPGDALVAISGSGRSRNVALAVSRSRQRLLRTAAIVGRRGPVSATAEVVVEVGADSLAVAEDVTIILLHWLYGTYMNGGRPA